ncbi:biotin--[acetyl-CoA-carboxylase] ligase [Nodularia sphaerocarpa]|uniref:biotin--[acetyl-CoA-carboxylase] ligase n=1 Tax=Nodularia sphaerocarpa TaxID=137816 RepID=UPI001EFAA97B|nr:biotin--[acetyl-CoA-carboxylase] ligase [Nodularia sphaerocarpa]MDB9372203.1 biotin--[acetyl-CoA-carboxylase] ligase [Nodularia sphaerocarpa CS-585]ULP72244.1 Bifunctional ligase/repressor BirA [Nodularia sphaerocarpa UHCC 0038]
MGFNRQLLETILESRGKYTYLPSSLHIFESVPSTNQTLWDLLKQGADKKSVVIATQQTSGRGQWGRQWISPTGGLYLSVGIVPKLEAKDSYQLTLASAWGIAALLRQCGVSVGIKWPNDLVLHSRKLGGILTETKVHNGQIMQAVIGVGINWANPVPDTGINLESWQATQPTQAISCLEMLTTTVLLGIESGIECLCQEGVNVLLSRYLDLLTNIGEQVYINNLLGTVVGVTSQGKLHVSFEANDPNHIKTPEIYVEPGTISLGYCKSSVLI